MKEIFDLKRFGRFFLYDLRNSRNYFWLSLLICSSLPLVCFAIVQMCARIFSGSWINEGMPIQVMSVFMAVLIVSLTFPVKAYGSITDKRYGSSWVMIPASSVEKTLSMILISGVVLPVVFVALLAGFDWLVSLVFPDYWPAPLITELWGLDDFMKEQSEGLVQINIRSMIIYCWVSNILTFTLGAIFFKKAKVGKTFLVLFVLGQAMSILMSVFLIGTPSFSELMNGQVQSFEDPAFALRILENIGWFCSIYCGIYMVALIAALWARVKTIKH